MEFNSPSQHAFCHILTRRSTAPFAGDWLGAATDCSFTLVGDQGWTLSLPKNVVSRFATMCNDKGLNGELAGVIVMNTRHSRCISDPNGPDSSGTRTWQDAAKTLPGPGPRHRSQTGRLRRYMLGNRRYGPSFHTDRAARNAAIDPRVTASTTG